MSKPGKCIELFQSNTKTYSVRATEHALLRMTQRDIKEETIKQAAEMVKPMLNKITEGKISVFLEQFKTIVIFSLEGRVIKIVTTFKNTEVKTNNIDYHITG